MCSDYNYKLQKQFDLLTLGLLQEKRLVNELRVACKLAANALQDADATYAKAAIEQAL